MGYRPFRGGYPMHSNHSPKFKKSKPGLTLLQLSKIQHPRALSPVLGIHFLYKHKLGSHSP